MIKVVYTLTEPDANWVLRYWVNLPSWIVPDQG